MLLIMEMSLNRPQQMTADGLHHVFRPSALPAPHTVRPFVGRLMDEVQVWAEGLRGGPVPVELVTVRHFCRRCGQAEVLLTDYAYFYVQWVVVDADWSAYEDGSWLARANHCCQVNLLPAYQQGGHDTL